METTTAANAGLNLLGDACAQLLPMVLGGAPLAWNPSRSLQCVAGLLCVAHIPGSSHSARRWVPSSRSGMRQVANSRLLLTGAAARATLPAVSARPVHDADGPVHRALREGEGRAGRVPAAESQARRADTDTAGGRRCELATPIDQRRRGWQASRVRSADHGADRSLRLPGRPRIAHAQAESASPSSRCSRRPTTRRPADSTWTSGKAACPACSSPSCWPIGRCVPADKAVLRMTGLADRAPGTRGYLTCPDSDRELCAPASVVSDVRD